VRYKPVALQEAVTALAPPLESVPIQLVVQKVHMSGGPDCLVMFDNGSHTRKKPS
jgi:hypothetical protein